MRDLPYGLTPDQLVLDPSTLRRFDEGELPKVSTHLTALTNEPSELKQRVWNAALLLFHELMLNDMLDDRYTTRELFQLAFDTAVVWEFG